MRFRIVLPVNQDGSGDDSPFYRDILQVRLQRLTRIDFAVAVTC